MGCPEYLQGVERNPARMVHAGVDFNNAGFNPRLFVMDQVDDG